MISFKTFISEKHLTPNELKKREEIAKSMEKENPSMPMDKKMAIATATAKKVTEAVNGKKSSGGVGKDLDGLRNHSEWDPDKYQQLKNQGLKHASIKKVWDDLASAKKQVHTQVVAQIEKQNKEKEQAAKTAKKLTGAKKPAKSKK